ncbi:MAG TPA: ABC transporter substrate-binding protein [Stellaceae bacterium]|nr:ABC transporter substrate-binding protein [Stellaceae bacterium]
MRRREFIAAAMAAVGGAALALPRAARAQSAARLPLVGVLSSGSASNPIQQKITAALDDGLRALGWIEGKTLRVERRWTETKSERIPALAKELVALAPDVIVAATTVVLAALQRETRTIPIVFAQVSDPVAQGFVTSLAHPDGNITGFTAFEFGIGGKWLGLLKEVAPDLARVMFLFNPDTSPQSSLYLRSLEAAAPSAGLAIAPAPIHDQAQIEPAFDVFARQPHGALVIATDNFLQQRLDLVIGLAARYGMPAIYPSQDFVSSGGLMSYGFDQVDSFRRAATYVDRILKGAKPGELPIQEPTKYVFAINLKTAKALGLAIPPTLLARADAVIE